MKEGNITLSWTNVGKAVAALVALGGLIGTVKAMPKVVETQAEHAEKIAVLETARSYTDKRLEVMDEKLDRILYRLPRRQRAEP